MHRIVSNALFIAGAYHKPSRHTVKSVVCETERCVVEWRCIRLYILGYDSINISMNYSTDSLRGNPGLFR